MQYANLLLLLLLLLLPLSIIGVCICTYKLLWGSQSSSMYICLVAVTAEYHITATLIWYCCTILEILKFLNLLLLLLSQLLSLVLHK